MLLYGLSVRWIRKRVKIICLLIVTIVVLLHHLKHTGYDLMAYGKACNTVFNQNVIGSESSKLNSLLGQ